MEDGDSSRESGIDEVQQQQQNGGVPELDDEEETGRIRVSGKGDDDMKRLETEGCGPERSLEAEGENEGDTCHHDEVFGFVAVPVEEDGGGVPNNRTCGDDVNRISVKKNDAYDTTGSQDRRRKETLQWQKQRRDEILDKIRQLDDSAYSDSETEDEMDFVQNVRQNTTGGGASQSGTPQLQEIEEEVTNTEAMDVVIPKSSRSKRKQRYKDRYRYKQAPCKPMLSEWMLERPEDLEEMWLGVLCPVGKRCIVMASHGKTKIFSRNDEYLGSYKSSLPGGCRYNYRDSTTNRNRGVTILDCIWSPQTETFYVLDLICWNSHSCVNCDTEYRQFFLHSKFAENLELLESSQLNPFPFKPLSYFEAREVSAVMTSSISFPEEVDGVLFFHRESFYISETNPLCLWILLTQVESLLNVYVAPELLSRQRKPKNLSSRRRQIEKRNGNAEQKIVVK